MRRDPVILTCAVTGSIHTPSMSDALPVTPEEIAQSAIGAARAGASILHIHARDPDTGRPDPSPALFATIRDMIRAECDAILNFSTGGGQPMTVADRAEAAVTLGPEVCSLNMGTMNFGIFPLARKPRTWRHDWELPHLADSDDFVFRNTFRDIRGLVSRIGPHGTRFEFECYDLGHVRSLAWFIDEGEIAAPVFVQFVLGVLGGIEASAEALMALKAAADRLIGPENYRFSVASASSDQYSLAVLGALLGGHVRVGLEDSLWLAPGQPARSNAEQVAKIRGILEDLAYSIATPAETRDLLGIPDLAGDTAP
jgi:uncharacterized protein (DUF849 family)